MTRDECCISILMGARLPDVAMIAGCGYHRMRGDFIRFCKRRDEKSFYTVLDSSGGGNVGINIRALVGARAAFLSVEEMIRVSCGGASSDISKAMARARIMLRNMESSISCSSDYIAEVDSIISRLVEVKKKLHSVKACGDEMVKSSIIDLAGVSLRDEAVVKKMLSS